MDIKMFDDRLVFESPGKLPGQVKPTNIRHTHFSRNPKIAAFLKAYHFVKEFGEGFDRICREQEANGANAPSFRTDEFILKITVPKVAEKVAVNDERVNVNVTEKVNATENVTDASQKTSQKTSQKIIDLIKEDPYISTTKMAEIIGVDRRNIARNIKKLQEQGAVRRVGPDKGGFWEVIV
jgi:ATP-dependent DNA helicase RecG